MTKDDFKATLNGIMTGEEITRIIKFASSHRERRNAKKFAKAYEDLAKAYGGHDKIPAVVLLLECKSADILRDVMAMELE